MRASITITGSLDGLLEDWTEQTARLVTDVTEHAASTMRDELRSAMSNAGLSKLGRALGYSAYPGGSRASLHPAAEVFVRGKAAAKWEGIIDAFNDGATIRSKRGWLAIPTKNCPKGARGRYLTPEQVAERFGPLRSIAAGKSVLLFADVISGKSGGSRKATAGRLAQGREAKLTLMFVLVKEATIRKRLDLDAVIRQWGTRFPAMIADALKAE
jgi:hypothetical protein